MLNKNKNILLIDDQQAFLNIYGDRLKMDGFKVFTASNVAEAKGFMAKTKMDLIVTDIVMPEVTGLEFLKELKSDPEYKNVPVIIMSVLGSAENVQEGLDLGANDYLVKGMHTPNDVSRKIEKATNTGSAVGQTEYLLKIKGNELDARKLQVDLELTQGFVCEKCGSEKALRIIPHTSHKGWFDAELMCPTCEKNS